APTFPLSPTATTPPPTLSLHDALPICRAELPLHRQVHRRHGRRSRRPLRDGGDLRLRERALRGRRPSAPRPRLGALRLSLPDGEIGRAHVRTPVTFRSRMPSSA